MYKIYQTRIAPNARRLRIFLAEKGVTDVEYVTVNILEGENIQDAFLKKNPFGRIPVLELEDGTTLSESVAISRYFEEKVPEPPLFGEGALGKALVEQWNRRAEMGFMMPAAMAFRNISGTFKDREYCDAAYGEQMRKPARKALELLDQQLQETKFLAGDALSVADISLVAGFDFFSSVKVVLPEEILEQLPGLKRWHADMSARPSYGA